MVVSETTHTDGSERHTGRLTISRRLASGVLKTVTLPDDWQLSSLPDVAITSPADTQVLTYQSSSSKWINAAAPTGGGGGGGGGDKLLLNYTETADLSGSVATSTWTNVGTSHSFTVTDASATIEVGFQGIVRVDGSTIALVTSSFLLDGTTRYKLGGSVDNGSRNNILAGAGPVPITGLSAASHTVQLQTYVNAGTGTINCACSTTPNSSFLMIRVWQRAMAP